MKVLKTILGEQSKVQIEEEVSRMLKKEPLTRMFEAVTLNKKKVPLRFSILTEKAALAITWYCSSVIPLSRELFI